MNGIIVCDESDPSSFKKIPVDGTWSGAAPLSANTVALLNGSTLDMLDVTTGAIATHTLQLHGAPEFLASG